MIDTWTAILTVHLTDSSVVVEPIEFPVAIYVPECDDLILLEPAALASMKIDYGSDKLVSQLLPVIEDEFGLLEMNFCQLTFEVVLDSNPGQTERRLSTAFTVRFLSLSAEHIKL